jgi:hypothetical protein
MNIVGTTARRPPRTGPVPPCTLCGTTGGAPNGRQCRRPARFSGERYGVEGLLCNRCRMRRVNAGEVRDDDEMESPR